MLIIYEWGGGGGGGVVVGCAEEPPDYPTLMQRPIKLYDVETEHVLDSGTPDKITYLYKIIKYHR